MLPLRATVRASIAPLLDDARASATQISQLLRGHAARVLEERGDWMRFRGADGYEGWGHRGAFTIEPASIAPIHPAWEDERRLSIGCTIRTSDGRHRSLPLGAVVEPDDIVVAGLAMNRRGRSRYFARSGDLLVQRATELFWGAPYLWGGVTPWGADCSGFVQTLFALAGVYLPRDAWQQAEIGVDPGNDPTELRAGDLLFFSDREDSRITHVAMSTGGPIVVHSSLANGEFASNSLQAADPVAARLQTTFRVARRVL
jgi:hypothetical protein